MEVYVDMMSQPSRAVALLCKITQVPHTINLVQIAKRQNRTPEFLELSPNGKVPALKHGDFALYESHAILRYICENFPVEDHWYPKDAQQRALVNQFLDWHHANLRYGAAGYMFNILLGPNMGIKINPDQTKQLFKVLKRSLAFLNTVLEGKTYLTGSTKPSIADLSLFCEIDSVRMDVKFYSTIESDYPNVYAWMLRVEKDCGTHYAGVAKVLHLLTKRQASKL